MAGNIDCDLLVSLIEERPVLWDKTIIEYRDKFKKTSAWKEVCQIIDPSFEEKSSKEKTKFGNEVLAKWKNIKDNFSKYAKKLESLNKSGSGAKKLTEYHLYKQLLFLKKNAANLTDSSIVEDNDSDVENQGDKIERPRYQQTSRKRKSNDEFESEILQVLKETENRHLSFFKAILPSLNKLDDRQTLIFQSRVLQVLTDFHQPQYQYNSQSSQTGNHTTYLSNYQSQRPQTSFACSNYQSAPNLPRCQINQYQSPTPSASVSKTPDTYCGSDMENPTAESEYDFS